MSDKPTLSAALKQLESAVLDTVEFFQKIDYSDLPTLLKAFKQIHEAEGALKDQYEIIRSIYEKLSYEKVPDVLEANGFDSVKANGRNYIVSVRINASIPAEQRESGFKWLRDVAKTPELIVPAVNPKSLSSFVKSYFEANAEWPPEDAIKVHKQKYTSTRKA